MVFYEREINPFLPKVVKGKQAFILGRRSRFVSEEAWSQFLADLQNTHNFMDGAGAGAKGLDSYYGQKIVQLGRAIVFVEKNLEGIERLGSFLDLNISDAATWSLSRKSAEEISKETERFIDGIIGAKMDYCCDNGMGSGEIEAMAILALSGDAEAQRFLKEQAERLRLIKRNDSCDQADRIKHDDWRDKFSHKKEADEFLKELVGVTLIGSPSLYTCKTPDGDLLLRTRFDVRLGDFPRNTIHFVLNTSQGIRPELTSWLGII